MTIQVGTCPDCRKVVILEEGRLRAHCADQVVGGRKVRQACDGEGLLPVQGSIICQLGSV